MLKKKINRQINKTQNHINFIKHLTLFLLIKVILCYSAVCTRTIHVPCLLIALHNLQLHYYERYYNYYKIVLCSIRIILSFIEIHNHSILSVRLCLINQLSIFYMGAQPMICMHIRLILGYMFKYSFNLNESLSVRLCLRN